jgi:hypothetical protein
LFFSYESRPDIAFPTHFKNAVEWLFPNLFCMYIHNLPTYHITHTHTILIGHIGATTFGDAPTGQEYSMFIAKKMASTGFLDK